MIESLQKTMQRKDNEFLKLQNKSKAHTRVVQPRKAYKYAPPRDQSTSQMIALNATSSYANLNRSASQVTILYGGSEHTARASSTVVPSSPPHLGSKFVKQKLSPVAVPHPATYHRRQSSVPPMIARRHQHQPYGSPLDKTRRKPHAAQNLSATRPGPPLHSPSYDASKDSRAWDSFEIMAFESEDATNGPQAQSAAEQEYRARFDNKRFNELILHTSKLTPADMNWVIGQFYEGSHRLEKIEIYDFSVRDADGVECTDVCLARLFEQVKFRGEVGGKRVSGDQQTSMK